MTRPTDIIVTATSNTLSARAYDEMTERLTRYISAELARVDREQREMRERVARILSTAGGAR